MKIKSNIGKYIDKLLATVSNVEVYEVEVCWYDVNNTHYITSYSDHFTTLEEADLLFMEKVKIIKNITEHNTQMLKPCDKYKIKCTMRKIKASSGSDRWVTHIIKEATTTHN